MNSWGIASIHAGDTTATKSVLNELPPKSVMPQNRIRSDDSIRTSMTPASLMAVSAEELTFQFSEVAEAKETALEERIARQAQIKAKNDFLRVGQIKAIIKLMEGKDGYDVLRAQARSFATSFQMDPAAALKHLEMHAMSPEKKFAIMNLAIHSVNDKASELSMKLQLSGLAGEVGSSFAPNSLFASAAPQVDETDASAKEAFFGAVSMRPTIRAIWDQLNEQANVSLSESLSKIQNAWSRSDDLQCLENIGALIIVHRIMQVIRSMMHSSEYFLNRLGVLDVRNDDLTKRYTRSFIDMAQSTMPSTLIDKMMESLKTAKRRCPRCSSNSNGCSSCKGENENCHCQLVMTCRCKDMRTYTLSVLHWHVRQWPVDIWVSIDARKNMLDQLFKKQGAPTGLMGKRLMAL